MTGMNGLEKFINQVICGDALEILREMPDESIDLGITSPPYNKKEKHGGWLVDKSNTRTTGMLCQKKSIKAGRWRF